MRESDVDIMLVERVQIGGGTWVDQVNDLCSMPAEFAGYVITGKIKITEQVRRSRLIGRHSPPPSRAAKRRNLRPACRDTFNSTSAWCGENQTVAIQHQSITFKREHSSMLVEDAN